MMTSHLVTETGISVGNFLRERRQQRQWSLTRTAQEAGIAKSTLSKWENGAVVPRRLELSRVLDTLKVSESERAMLLQGLGRAESRRVVPSCESEDASKIHSHVGGFPVHGDLLRALRHRAGLTQAEAARRARIAQGTLAKWECGADWPSTERLHTLAFVLDATAEEAAILTTGLPTYFPGARNPLAEADLEEISRSLLELRRQSYNQRYAPYDLWFLSLLARLWPASLRDDGFGERAFYLWVDTSYCYLLWLYLNFRSDALALSDHFMTRIRQRLSTTSDAQLWTTYSWVCTNRVMFPLEQFLNRPENFMKGTQLSVSVPANTIQVIRDSTSQLERVARSKKAYSTQAYMAMHARALNDSTNAYLAALTGDVASSLRLDNRVAAFWGDDGKSHDVLQWRAQTYYALGETNRALDFLSEIPSASAENPADTSAAANAIDAASPTDLQRLVRLEILGFRARALLDQEAAAKRDEGHYLLSIFNRELSESGFPSRIAANLGPLPVPVK